MERNTEESKINEIASKHLGAAGSYAIDTDQFDPSFLVAMPRVEARKDWGITGTEFVGMDVWHCHESTFLLDNGVPVAGTLKFSYPSNSEFMVESKSMKLYLNTFDMCKMGASIADAEKAYCEQIKKDLQECLGTNVQVSFHWINGDYNAQDPTVGYVPIETTLSQTKDLYTMVIDDYKAEKNHLQFIEGGWSEGQTYMVSTNALRSRCRHTKQKDTGAAYIKIKTKPGVSLVLKSLFKQIVSLRNVDEFHEFCSEKLYTEIMKTGKVEECSVMLLYSRRGSLDINPVRATRQELLNEVLCNTSIYTKKALGQ